MKVLVVHAHPEAKSFNSALKDLAVTTLQEKGHTVSVSDLYAMKFNPVGGPNDFQKLMDQNYFNYVLEQRNASTQQVFSEDIAKEQQKVTEADFIIFNFPLWWFSVPAILKGWFDRVFALGFSWEFGKIYENGLLRGKKGMLTVTTGGTDNLYDPAGFHRASIETILHPVQYGTLHFCGIDVLSPFLAFGVFQAGDEGRKKYLESYKKKLENLESDAPVLKY